MRRSSLQRWSKTRQKGLRPWLFRRGMLGWGVPMYIFMSVLQIVHHPGNWVRIALTGLPLWLAAGVLWGALTWATMELLYRRHQRAARGG